MENEKLKNKVNKSTKQQLLRSPDIQPTSEVIEEALGTAYNSYLMFVKET